jgi:bifunctional non-homologous end joining protein LigD
MSTTGRRAPKRPLLEIGRAIKKEDALAGLERWKSKHADAAAHLQAADVLVDAMRGRFTTWTRIRVNLEHVPEELRPAQEPLDPDEDPWRELVARHPDVPRRKPARARKAE